MTLMTKLVEKSMICIIVRIVRRNMYKVSKAEHLLRYLSNETNFFGK